MPTPTVSGLYTTVKNTSGKTATFGFLGARGKRLTNGATYTVAGDLIGTTGVKTSQREFKALERALVSGALQIVSTPAVYVTDTATNVSRQLKLTSGTLGVAVPSGWYVAPSSSGSSS